MYRDDYAITEEEAALLGDEKMVRFERRYYDVESQLMMLNLLGMRDLSDEIRKEMMSNR